MTIEREFLKKLRYATHLENDLRKELEYLLAQPEQTEQQPEAWIIVNRDTGYRIQVSLFPDLYNKDMFEVIPLYTAPPKPEPLNDEEIHKLSLENFKGILSDRINFVRAIEKAHGIGGGG